jgi:hypothetical protein
MQFLNLNKLWRNILKNVTYALSVFSLMLASVASVAHADGINLSHYEGKTLTATIEPYASGENNGVDYVGLTQVNFSSGHSSLGSAEGFCVDFNDTISTPATYSVTIESVAGNTTLEQEAYYGSLFNGNSVLDTDLQELIWNYTAPHNEQFALNSEMLALQHQMLANYKSGNYSDDFYLDANGKGQSFVVDATPVSSPVPEPSSLALFGTGMLTFAGFVKRKIFA